MRLFEGNPYNGYQRIKRASPNFLDDVLDIQAIYNTAGIEHDNIRDGITGATNAALIPWTNEEDIAIWEEFLGISYAGSEEMPPLDYRQGEVASHFHMLHHVGRRELYELCSVFVPGQNSEVDWDANQDAVVSVLVDGYIPDEMRFLGILQSKIPAHLPLDLTVRITRTFRWDLTASFGGGTEGHFQVEPVDAYREERQDLAVHMAGITHGDFRGEPVDVNRSEEYDLDIRQAGSSRSSFKAEPIDTLNRSVFGIPVSEGAQIKQMATAPPLDTSPHTTKYEAGIASGGSVMTTQTRSPMDTSHIEAEIDTDITQTAVRFGKRQGHMIDTGPNEQRIKAPSPGGAFIVSHISTKRVDE
ncbi:MAG: hypothetical protein NC311_15220 [Muribaculaceae bacterium]|nr:hypothetical protein [Muribaculaceae bacterium]